MIFKGETLNQRWVIPTKHFVYLVKMKKNPLIFHTSGIAMEISLVELAPGGESISMTFLTLLETFLSTCIHYFKLSLLENLILSFKVLFSYTNLKMKAMNNILKNNCGNLFFFIQMIDINRTDFNHHPLHRRRRLF